MFASAQNQPPNKGISKTTPETIIAKRLTSKHAHASPFSKHLKLQLQDKR